MASPANMGGLYATVNLDTGDAIAKLKALRKEMQRALNPKGVAQQGPRTLTQRLRDANKEMLKTAESAKKVDRNVKQIGRSAARTAKETKSIGSNLTEGFSTTLASFGAARSGNVFYAMSSALRGVQRAGFAAGGGLTAAGLGVAGVVTAAIAGVGAVGAFGFAISKLGRESVKSAENLEVLQVSFEALLGSQERAAEEFAFIVESSKISPFFTDAIVRLDRFLLAQGILNDDLRRGLVKTLIEFGAAAGLTGDQLQNTAYALGQVYAAQRLTGDEARQLRNNMLGANLVLSALPRYANLSTEALNRLVKDGGISSRDFFEALFAYTSQFEGAALQMQQTFRGLKDTILDVFQLGLGQAALEVDAAFSPLEALKAPLKELLSIVETIDFQPLVASLGALFNVITQGITDWLSSGGGPKLVDFFTRALPNAILFVVNVVQVWWFGMRTYFTAVVNIFKATWTAAKAFAQGLGSAFGATISPIKLVAGAIAASFSAGATALGIFLGVVTGVASTLISFVVLVSSAFRGLFALLSGGSFADGWADGHKRALDVLAGGWEAASGVIKGAAGAIINAWEGVSDLEPIELPEFDNPFTDTGGPLGDPITDVSFPGQGGDGDGAGGAGGAAGKVSQEIQKAMDTLYDLSQRWFDLRSDLESGLLGQEGFEATIQSIISMGKRILQAATTIGDAKLIAAVGDGIDELLKLAKARDEAAESLKAAEKNLEQAISARDKFADKVRSSALAFANSFKTETETVKEFQQFSERGFFYETEQEKQKSFVESMKERVAAMKAFLANIKLLKEGGLDEGLLEELLAAGPDQAGETAKALAAGGQDMIDEVNTLQSAANQVADELADFGANEFYQAGVDMAQAQVDGLTTELQDITDAAENIVANILEVVAPFAVEMEEAGKAGGGGLAEGITASIPDIDTALGGVGGSFADHLLGINDTFEDFSSTGQRWMDDAVRMIEEGFGRMGDAIGRELEEWRQTHIPFSESLGFGLIGAIIKGIREGDLPGALSDWWYGKNGPVERWNSIWDNFREDGKIGFLEAMAGIISTIINFHPISWVLPINVDATNLHKLLVDAINWVIRQYNKIPFLPDITPLKYNGSGGQLQSGSYSLPNYNVPNPANNTRYPNPEVKVEVHLGNDVLDTYVQEIVDENSGQTDAYVYAGRSYT